MTARTHIMVDLFCGAIVAANITMDFVQAREASGLPLLAGEVR